jgi:hypothetical protein
MTHQHIPRPLVRANQWTIVITVIAFVITRIPALLLIPLAQRIVIPLFQCSSDHGNR